jgi:hypothetical protein
MGFVRIIKLPVVIETALVNARVGGPGSEHAMEVYPENDIAEVQENRAGHVFFSSEATT